MDEASGFSYCSCELCGRACKVNREEGQRGFCQAGTRMHIGRAAAHFWEEPCLSGTKGSGTIFFSSCGLSCVYCQNQMLSRKESGQELSVEELVEVFYQLEAEGCHNINFVTPEHYSPGVREAMVLAREKGFSLPFVWNSSGYQSARTLKALEGLVDIYLMDFKYWEGSLAERYSKAKNYPEIAKEALEEVVRQCPELYYRDGLLKKGVILRHLLLPGQVYQGKRILKYSFSRYGNQILYSLLSQYTPFGALDRFPEINRKVFGKEYQRLVDYALSLGIEKAFIQEGESAKESFIPDFCVQNLAFKENKTK